MRYDKADHEWLRLFALFEPTVDKTRFCPCRCHSVLHNTAGLPTIEGRLGILESEEDYVCACAACNMAHYKAVLRRRASEAA